MNSGERIKAQIKNLTPEAWEKFKKACVETGKPQAEVFEEILAAYQSGDTIQPARVELKDPELERLLYKIEKDLRSGSMTQGKADGYRLRLKNFLHKGLIEAERREIQRLGKLLEEFTPSFSPSLNKQIESKPKLAFMLWCTGRMKNSFQVDEELGKVAFAYDVEGVSVSKADLEAYIEHIRVRHVEEEVKRGRSFFNYFSGDA